MTIQTSPADDIGASAHLRETVEVYNLWAAAKRKAGTGLPRFRDFNLATLGPHRAYVVTLAPMGQHDFLLASYGEEFARVLGYDLTGLLLSEIEGDTAQALLSECLAAAAHRRPRLIRQRAVITTLVHQLERLILPVEMPDGSVQVFLYNRPLRLQHDLVHAILEASPAGIAAVAPVYDKNGDAIDFTFIAANRLVARIAGLPDQSLVDRSVRATFPAMEEHFYRRGAEVLKSGQAQTFDLKHPVHPIVYRMSIAPFEGGLVATFTDIGELVRANQDLEQQRSKLVYLNAALEKQAGELAYLADETEKARAELAEEVHHRTELEAELRRQASVDDMTGTLNRRSFLDCMRAEFLRSRRYGHEVTFILFDLDRFKGINDTFGHLAGDRVLKDVAEAITSGLRDKIDLVGRLGGEEFGVLLPETPLDGALIVAERLRQAVEGLDIRFGGQRVPATISLGVAQWIPGEALEQCHQRADDALYAAKRDGRNRVVQAAMPTPAWAAE